MRLPSRLLLASLMIAGSLALSGCKSSKEKAEDYYQSGLTYMAAGDTDHALVEFRNVFKYDGFHKEARKAYADIMLKRGDVAEAYSQYLRLIEQYPDTVEVRQILAELAIARGDWEEAERHGRAAIALTPDAPAVQAIASALAYRTALLAKDTAGADIAVKQARTLLATLPDNEVALRVVIASQMSGPDPQAAMPDIEHALQLAPKAIEFHVLKYRLLAQKQDMAGMGQELQVMVETFPDNEEARSALIAWYMTQKDFTGAEAFLRKLAGPDDGPVDGHIAVVQFLQATQGEAAATAELDRLAAANPGTASGNLYQAQHAAIDFAAGRQDVAISAVEAILAKATPSDETRRIKTVLAKMLVATGNQVGARAKVEEVLAEDATNTDALKMRAVWLIGEDKADAAIIDLRTALSQNPRDSATLTLMAEAHERNGNLDLAGDQLAQAVDVSGKGAQESLRYAQFLQSQGRAQVAEAVLADARQAHPDDPAILTQLGRLALDAQDWTLAKGVADDLRKVGSKPALDAATTIEAAILQGQGSTDDSLSFLQAQIGQGGDDIRATAQIVQTQLKAGKAAEARTFLDGEIAKKPDDPDLQMISANLHAVAGETAAAEAAFRKIIADHPQAENPVRLLYGLLASAGRRDEAAAVLAAGLAASPKSGTLRWLQAGALEQGGDFEGAIKIYEALYAEDSSNVLVANNLASLITSHRDDPASLDRAAVVARRLKGSDIPAFQDTYGWIQFRRGNLDEALANLEPAAKGLPQDPLTQVHLGLTYAALNQADKARDVLTRALEIAGDSPLPQFAEARAALAKLPAAGAAPAVAPAPAAPAPAP